MSPAGTRPITVADVADRLRSRAANYTGPAPTDPATLADVDPIPGLRCMAECALLQAATVWQAEAARARRTLTAEEQAKIAWDVIPAAWTVQALVAVMDAHPEWADDACRVAVALGALWEVPSQNPGRFDVPPGPSVYRPGTNPLDLIARPFQHAANMMAIGNGVAIEQGEAQIVLDPSYGPGPGVRVAPVPPAREVARPRPRSKRQKPRHRH